MRSALVGAVESTQVMLEALLRHGMPPQLFCTLPQQKSHRHCDFLDLAPMARKERIEVIETANSNEPACVQRLRELNLDHIFVLGWSQICSPEFLSIPRAGAIGYHPSALPKNRGRGVIPWTILQNLTESAGSVFWLNEQVDAGDILIQETFPVAEDETARTLCRKHMKVLQNLLDRALPLLAQGSAPRTPQDHARATFCAKRTEDDGLIDWQRPAEQIWTLIRAVGQPYPGAFTYYNRRKLIVWDAELVGSAPFCGLPGQVQEMTENGVLVQCGDQQHVRLGMVQLDGDVSTPANRLLKIHCKLGFDWADLHTRLVRGQNDI